MLGPLVKNVEFKIVKKLLQDIKDKFNKIEIKNKKNK